MHHNVCTQCIYIHCVTPPIYIVVSPQCILVTQCIYREKCYTMYIHNVYKNVTQCILGVHHNVYRYHVPQSTPATYIEMQHNVYKLQPNVYTPFWLERQCIGGIYIVLHFIYIVYIHCGAFGRMYIV